MQGESIHKIIHVDIHKSITYNCYADVNLSYEANYDMKLGDL